MNKKQKHAIKVSVFFIVVPILIFVLAILALRIGSVNYSTAEIFNGLFDANSSVHTIIIDLRLPRVILAIIIGMCLAAAGALLQAVMQNPLADPGIIGVSSGASTAATIIFLVFPTATDSVPIFSFVGAAGACVLIYLLSWKRGADPVRIILAGVAINTMLSGVTSFLTLMNSDSLQGVLSWLNGSLSGKSWYQVQTMGIYGAIGIVLALLCIKGANVLQLGDDMAKNLGTRVNLTRVLLSAVSAFLAASTVAVVGMIGFVGLIVPHVTRMLVGSNHKVMLPASLLLGAFVVLAADTIGRTIVAPIEIPVGIVMSVVGGPFFLFLLRRKRKARA